MDASAAEMVREALLITLKVTAPILLVGVFIGLLISLIQSITSIQDQTVSLVPKIVAMVVVAGLLLPWILQRLVDYTTQVLQLTGA
jgi:flagellar biosynthetic protein FliQ